MIVTLQDILCGHKYDLHTDDTDWMDRYGFFSLERH